MMMKSVEDMKADEEFRVEFDRLLKSGEARLEESGSQIHVYLDTHEAVGWGERNLPETLTWANEAGQKIMVYSNPNGKS